MRGLEIWLQNLISSEQSPFHCVTNIASDSFCFANGGLFLQQSLPFASLRTSSDDASSYISKTSSNSNVFCCGSGRSERFMSVSLSSVKGSVECFDQESGNILRKNGDKVISEDDTMMFEMVDEHANKEKKKVKLRGGASAFNTTKHLWSGAVSAMVSSCVFKSVERKEAVKADESSDVSGRQVAQTPEKIELLAFRTI